MIKLNLEFNLMRLGDSCTQISRQNLRMLPNLSENIFPSVIFNNQLRNPKTRLHSSPFFKTRGQLNKIKLIFLNLSPFEMLHRVANMISWHYLT